MFDRLNSTAREVTVRAKREAEESRQPHIGTEHLLLALLDERAGIAYTVLHGAGVDRQRVRADIERLIRPPMLGTDDAAALQTIGIDLDAVLARIEPVRSDGPEFCPELVHRQIAAVPDMRAPGRCRRRAGGIASNQRRPD